MIMEHSLLSSCTSGGCGAKIPPSALAQLLSALPRMEDPHLLVGYQSSDDAAVYQINDQQCIVSTMDFFPPMVEDAYIFGKIAAANALSDVWAMGGRPLMALNMVCYPEKAGREDLEQMLKGGAEKVMEAGAVLSGGHSIYDPQIKYGLSVTGLVEQDKILRNDTPRVGDALLLTKPLGTGIVLAAARAGLAQEGHLLAAQESMMRLNGYAAQKMAAYDVSACTDVTGFGLINHLLEMTGGKACVQLHVSQIPHLPGALDYADDFLLTAAGQRNREHSQNQVAVNSLPFALQELLFDPQTSGGLLIAVQAKEARQLLTDIQKDDPGARLIGQILPQSEQEIKFS